MLSPDGGVAFRGPRVRMGIHFAAEGTVAHRRALLAYLPCVVVIGQCRPARVKCLLVIASKGAFWEIQVEALTA